MEIDKKRALLIFYFCAFIFSDTFEVTENAQKCQFTEVFGIFSAKLNKTGLWRSKFRW